MQWGLLVWAIGIGTTFVRVRPHGVIVSRVESGVMLEGQAGDFLYCSICVLIFVGGVVHMK